MPSRDRRVDAYIADAAPFAQPILARLREDVHAACPDVEEAIKWSMPFFVHAGRNLAHMAAFKAHCAFGFELGRAVVDLGREAQAMGQFGRITALADLPPKRALAAIIRQAMTLNEQGVKVPARERTKSRAEAGVPDALAKALARNAKARKAFEAFAPSRRREYCEWIAEAKRDETRERRVAQAIEWLAEGKARNWKYETRPKPD